MRHSKYMAALILTVIILFNYCVNAEDKTNTLNLMPKPLKTELTGGEFRLDAKFTVSLEGPSSERLNKAASRALRRLSGKTGLFFAQDYLSPEKSTGDASFKIKTAKAVAVKLYEDESYKLEITKDKVLLNAQTDIGALRGLETLLQLVNKDAQGYFFPQVKIEDSPRFAWRGLMMDVSRHFMPIDALKRNIEAMAAVKLNVFHWHLSDDQGFRVESKAFPKLTEMGSDGNYYTQGAVKDLIKFADDRGISVIPEFDIPGHSTAWFAGYPELASAPGPYTIERKWGIFDPTFDPTNEKTYEFFDKFLTEMAALFPNEFFHIGGDENNGKQWDSNSKIQEFKKAKNIPDNHTLQSYFNKRILEILTRNNKKMVGWDEILHPDMPKNIVIQSWRGIKSLEESAKKGYQVMLSNGYYIDLCFSTTDHYLNDPMPESIKLTDSEKKFILGGEATMWAELVTPETVDSRIWPRTAAIAERFWSPADVKDVRDMYHRLSVVSVGLEDLGVNHLRNRDMMIRRIIGLENNAPVINLLGAVEPLKEYARHAQRKDYTSYAPYTRLVDIATPDAEAARNFRFAVDDYLTGKAKNENELLSSLAAWKDNQSKMNSIINNNPILKEIEPLSVSLSEISVVGIQSLELIKSGKKADAGWVKQSLEKIKKAKEPSGQLEIMIVSAIEKLVTKVSE